MKNSFVVFISIGISLFSCKNVITKKNDLANDNLKGNVKSIRQTSYLAIEKFGEIQKGEKDGKYGYCSVTLYNEKGNKIEESEYDTSGDFKLKRIFKYNKEDDRIEESLYNSDGNLVSKTTNEYNDKRKIIETIIYKSDGSIESQSTCEYPNDSVMEVTHFRGGKGIVKFDDKGREIEEISPGFFGGKSTFKYDEKGNIIEENLMESSSGTKDGVNIKYKYDEKGNKTKEFMTGSDGITTTSSFIYKYDEKDNWVQEIYFNNNSPSTITERKIEYY